MTKKKPTNPRAIQSTSYLLWVPKGTRKQIRKQQADLDVTYEQMLLYGASLVAHLDTLLDLTGTESVEDLLSQIHK